MGGHDWLSYKVKDVPRIVLCLLSKYLGRFVGRTDLHTTVFRWWAPECSTAHTKTNRGPYPSWIRMKIWSALQIILGLSVWVVNLWYSLCSVHPSTLPSRTRECRVNYFARKFLVVGVVQSSSVGDISLSAPKTITTKPGHLLTCSDRPRTVLILLLPHLIATTKKCN